MLPSVTYRAPESRTSAYYRAPVSEFLSAQPASVRGTLAASHPFPLGRQPRDAREEGIQILKVALDGAPGTIFLEFEVPRLVRRVDAVLVRGPAVFLVEFKCGEDEYHLGNDNQAWDYALDLKNVHHFRDEGLRNPAAPYDHVVIFDEAQRAWDRRKAPDVMRTPPGGCTRGYRAGIPSPSRAT